METKNNETDENPEGPEIAVTEPAKEGFFTQLGEFIGGLIVLVIVVFIVAAVFYGAISAGRSWDKVMVGFDHQNQTVIITQSKWWGLRKDVKTYEHEGDQWYYTAADGKKRALRSEPISSVQF